MSSDEKKLMRQIVGGPFPRWYGKEWEEVSLIFGGRSAKTTLVSAIATYEACCNDWREFVREGELAWIFIFARKEKQAMDLGRNMIFQNIRRSVYLRSLIVDAPTLAQKAEFPYTKAGVMVLKTGAAITAMPCSSRVARGYAIAIVMFDEIAFYARESKNQVADHDLYDAVLPRQIQFGKKAKRFLISSPADKTGILWEKWRDRMKNKDLYTCIKTPTWIMRPDYPKEYFEKHKRLSPLTFWQEYGAEFSEPYKPFIPEKDLKPVLREDCQPIPPKPDVVYMMAIDAAFGDRDRFVVAVGHSEVIEGKDRTKVIVDVLEQIEASYDLDVHDAAVERIVSLYNEYNVFDLRCDQYQADAFSKTLEARGINVTADAWTAQKHRSKYSRLRSAIKQRLISIPDHPEMVDEFRTLHVKYLSSGQWTITHAAGGHDDFCDVVAEINDLLFEEETASIGIEVF